jgi:ATP-dependent Clp protease ATP-binding subunit ClpB
LQKRLEDNGFTLEVSDGAKKQLAEEGYDPVYGARPLKRTIQQRLQNELANAILGGEFEEGAHIVVDVQNGEFTFDHR